MKNMTTLKEIDVHFIGTLPILVPQISVNAVYALKQVAGTLGLNYYTSRDERRRLVYNKAGKPVKLVREEDVSYHGSPLWHTVFSTTNPEEIKNYQKHETFKEFLKTLQNKEKITINLQDIEVDLTIKDGNFVIYAKTTELIELIATALDLKENKTFNYLFR